MTINEQKTKPDNSFRLYRAPSIADAFCEVSSMDLEAYWAEVIQDAVAYMQRASDMLGQLALIEERAHNVDQRTQEALALLAASIDRQAQTLSEILTSMRDEDPQDNL